MFCWLTKKELRILLQAPGSHEVPCNIESSIHLSWLINRSQVISFNFNMKLDIDTQESKKN